MNNEDYFVSKLNNKVIWISAPDKDTNPSPNKLQGIWLDVDYDVEWIWTHSPNNSYVSGYKITGKK